MSWEFAFQAANLWAMLFWAVLIFLPRKPFAMSAIFFAGVGLLCLAYVIFFGLLLSGAVDPVAHGERGDAAFTSIAGVRALFATDAGVTIGWIHYLAFDLFTGCWIAKDADAKGFSRILQAPVLVLTLMAGPAGLLLWFLIRERRARAAAGPRRVN